MKEADPGPVLEFSNQINQPNNLPQCCNKHCIASQLYISKICINCTGIVLNTRLVLDKA